MNQGGRFNSSVLRSENQTQPIVSNDRNQGSTDMETHKIFGLKSKYVIAFPVNVTHGNQAKTWGDVFGHYRDFYDFVYKIIEYMVYAESHGKNEIITHPNDLDNSGSTSNSGIDPNSWESFKKRMNGTKLVESDININRTSVKYKKNIEIFIEKIPSKNKKKECGYVMVIYIKGKDLFKEAIEHIYGNVQKFLGELYKMVCKNITYLNMNEKDYDVFLPSNKDDDNNNNDDLELSSSRGNTATIEDESPISTSMDKKKTKFQKPFNKSTKKNKGQIKTSRALKYLLFKYISLKIYGRTFTENEITTERKKIDESNIIDSVSNILDIFKVETANDIMDSCGFDTRTFYKDSQDMVIELFQNRNNPNHSVKLPKDRFMRISFKDFSIDHFKGYDLPFREVLEMELIRKLLAFQNGHSENVGSKWSTEQTKTFFNNMIEKMTDLFNERELAGGDSLGRFDNASKRQIRKQKKSIENKKDAFKLLQIINTDEYNKVFTSTASSLETKGDYEDCYFPVVRKYQKDTMLIFMTLMESMSPKIKNILPLPILQCLEWKIRSRLDNRDGNVYFFRHSTVKMIKVKTRKKNRIDNKRTRKKKVELVPKRVDEPLALHFFDEKMDSLSNFLIYVITATRYIGFIKEHISDFILLIYATHDQFNNSYTLHYNCFLSGPCETGKSFLLDKKQELSIKGTTQLLSSDFGSKRNQQSTTLINYITYVMHESSNVFGGGRKMGSAKAELAELKSKMTSMKIGRPVLMFDEDGKAITKYWDVDIHMCLAVASNDPYDKIETALKSRLQDMRFKTSGKVNSIQDLKNGKKIRDKLDPESWKKYVHINHDIQYLVMLSFMAKNSKVTCPVESTMSSMILTKINKFFEDQGIPISRHLRKNDFIENIAQTLTIMKSWIETCMIPGSIGYRKKFEYSWIREAEKRQVITMQTMITAIGLAFPMYQNINQKGFKNYMFGGKINLKRAIIAYEHEKMHINHKITSPKKSNSKCKPGFTRISYKYNDMDLNFNYHLFALKWYIKKTKVSDTIDFALMEDKNGLKYYNLNYMRFKFKSEGDFIKSICGNINPSPDERSIKGLIYELKNYFIKPKHVLKYVAVDDLNTSKDMFETTTLLTHKNSSRTKFNDLLQGYGDQVMDESNNDESPHGEFIGEDMNTSSRLSNTMNDQTSQDSNQESNPLDVFKYIPNDKKDHKFNASFINTYNSESGLPAILTEWESGETIQTETQNKDDENISISEDNDGTGNRLGNVKKTKKTFKKKKGRFVVDVLLSLRRVDLYQFFISAIKSLQYRGMKPKKLIIPISKDVTYEFDTLHLTNTDNSLTLSNPSLIPTKEQRITKGAFHSHKQTREEKEKEALNDKDSDEEFDSDSDSDSSDDSSDESDPDEFIKDNSYKKSPSVKKIFDAIMSGEEIELGVDNDKNPMDIDDLSYMMHLEKLGVPYNQYINYTDAKVLENYKNYINDHKDEFDIPDYSTMSYPESYVTHGDTGTETDEIVPIIDSSILVQEDIPETNFGNYFKKHKVVDVNDLHDEDESSDEEEEIITKKKKFQSNVLITPKNIDKSVVMPRDFSDFQ